ncbi:hypothetical protein ACFVZH_36350 [Streptomyces sp. NPDC059534]|uniref:DUF7507 domain-containing protein n=1 Tax=Streptomyces sp. NPDC059534 TaxID=3346859 RepID=UPI00368CA6C6
MTRRNELSDVEWEFARPLLPESLRGRKRLDDRRVPNGVVRKFRTGTAWHRITYTYTVANEGSTSLDDIAVTDDRAADVVCEPTTLAPGANATCRATYPVAEEDARAGHVTNTARATGTGPEGATVESPPVRLRIPAACPPDDYGYGGCKDGEHGYGDNGYGESRDSAKRPRKETAH